MILKPGGSVYIDIDPPISSDIRVDFKYKGTSITKITRYVNDSGGKLFDVNRTIEFIGISIDTGDNVGKIGVRIYYRNGPYVLDIFNKVIDNDITETSEDVNDINSFVQLVDTPDTYVGNAGKVLMVKETEDGLEFKAGDGTISEYEDRYIVSDSSIYTYSLTYTPIEGTVKLKINGLDYSEGVDYTVDYTNKQITLNSDVGLEENDVIQIVYNY